MVLVRWASILVAYGLVSACGGGGASGLASTPTPPTAPNPPPPPPPAAASVTIFKTPVVGTYSSVGASIAGPGGNLDTYTSSDARYGSVSTDEASQPQIRYTAAGQYEVKMPGSDWDQLVAYKGLANPGPDNNYFQPASVAANEGYVVTRNSYKDGYAYSELASWGSKSASRWGYVAFGSLTQAGAVPTSGTASFEGVVSGSTDIMLADNLYGGYFPLPTDGSVSLNLDFGKGTLAGAMTLYLPDGMNPTLLGTFNFKETIYSVGSTNYAGKFDTAAAGQNFFLGRFTGPTANETIGAWAIPFVFIKDGDTFRADQQTHQAFGAWIAKRGN